MAYRMGRCLLPDYLDEIDMTPAEFARRLGVSRQQVDKWINNRQKMNMESAKNCAVLLDLEHADDLYEWIIIRNQK